MKQKIVAGLLALTVMVSFSGCAFLFKGNGERTSPDDIVPSTPAPTEEATEKVTEKATETKAESKPPQTSVTVDVPDEAVPLGEWQEIAVRTPSSEYYAVKMRINEYITDQDTVKEYFDTYNQKSQVMQLKELEGTNAEYLQYVVLRYEIDFPADYPPSYGGQTISPPSLSLSGEPTDGEKFKSLDGKYTFWGVGSVYTIPVKSDEQPKPGDTLKNAMIFTMVKDYADSDWNLKCTFKESADAEDKTVYFGIE
jgi:hypothetical protein